jgi:hypothetical protein
MTHITIERAKLEQVLEALQITADSHDWFEEVDMAIVAIKQALAAPVQEPVAIDELTDIFHKAWQKDFKESVLGGMSSGSEELKGQWREHVKVGIRALLAAQPAPVQPIKPSLWEQSRGITEKGQP